MKKTILPYGIRLSIKIALVYMLLAFISWIVIILVFARLNYNNMRQSAETLAEQTLASTTENVIALIENASYYSQIILSNIDIISALENDDMEGMTRILHQYALLAGEKTGINGIYIWNLDSNGCSMDKNQVRELRTGNIKEISWYNEVEKLKGSEVIKMNADKVLTESDLQPSVSIIRMINSPYDFQPLGIMMINLDISAFKDSWYSVSKSDVSDIYILDETGKVIASRAELSLPRFSEGLEEIRGESGKIFYREKEIYIAQKKVEDLDWRVLVGVPIKTTYINAVRSNNIWALMVLASITLFCVAGYFSMKHFVAKPLEKITRSINRMNGNKFEKIKNMDGNSFEELDLLREIYNQMVDKIDELILKIHEEEKIKRKAELSSLQEQMKPHFLYNTIDAMSYLALSGKNEELYDALEAFGSYYRILLSKGKEMITIREELCMVKDYLELQKIRYSDSLHYVIQGSPEVEQTYILKMVIQPLVENSVNHGIRPKMTPGVVFVECKKEDRFLKIIVEDDGVGMTEECLMKIQRETLDENEKSFGLRGTMERLKIFYEQDISYEIKSSLGKGTSISIILPILYEGDMNYD